MAEGSFSGKVAMVTGAASGIGKATAVALAAAGAAVMLGDLNEEGLAQVETEIKAAGGRACALRVDVSDSATVDATVARAIAEFGGLHFAVNCAGIAVAGLPLADFSEEQFDKAIDVNLKGTWFCLRAQIPRIIESGGGAIVNVASTMGIVAGAMSGPYIATKHGVVGLTKSAAMDYSAKGVRVNAVCPGGTQTGMVSQAVLDAILPLHPIGRISQPSEIASAILFLLSPAASFITGVALPVDGGWTVH